MWRCTMRSTARAPATGATRSRPRRSRATRPTQRSLRLKRTMLEAGNDEAIGAAIQLGKAAAAAVLAKRATDGSNGKQPWADGTRPGQYRFTAPFDFAAAPHWRQVTPFVLTSVSQFRTAPPPAPETEAYRRDFDEVKRVGGKISEQRGA